MVRPRVVVEDWVDDGIHWFGVRFGYSEDEVLVLDPVEVVMSIKEALVNATAHHSDEYQGGAG